MLVQSDSVGHRHVGDVQSLRESDVVAPGRMVKAKEEDLVDPESLGDDLRHAIKEHLGGGVEALHALEQGVPIPALISEERPKVLDQRALVDQECSREV